MLEITERAIDIPGVLDSVRSKTAGGVVHFIGVVRDDEGIEGLSYESYPEMALSEMRRIVPSTVRCPPMVSFAGCPTTS